MKVCWDNLENLYLSNKGNLRDGKHSYQIKECVECKDEFLSNDKSSIFCSKNCAKKGKNYGLVGEKCYNFNKNHSIKTILKMKESKIGDRNPNYKCGDLTWYDTYAHRISYAEEIRRSPDNENILEVKCKYCGKWFKPKSIDIKRRVTSLEGKSAGENLLYCSNECKKKCPVFYKKKFSSYEHIRKKETNKKLRRLVLERDEYECVRCGSKICLECHHINPRKIYYKEKNDIDNCITLCKECHKKVHSKEGDCSYGYLSNKIGE